MNTLANVALTFLVFGVVSSADMILKDNGYENVLVAISDNVPEDDEIIKNIKSIFTTGSGYLYRATRFRAYFRSITILVPSNWTKKTEYESTTNDEVFNNAALRVDRPDPEFGDTPFARMYTRCGAQGLYIHLTPKFVTNVTFDTRHYGPRGKTLVHEWGHYRWGVFDEYPTETHYYVHGGTFHPTRCHSSIPGTHQHNETKGSCTIDPKTKLPDKYCRFIADLDQKETTASYMYKQFLKNIADFCDDGTLDIDNIIHNKMAPNNQNSICNRKSTWEVMRETVDFKDGRNPPNANKNLKTTPTFRLVQQGINANKSVVFLFDVSASMKGEAIQMMRQIAIFVIENGLKTGSYVGIVSFSARARTILGMTRLKNMTDNEKVARFVPEDIGGTTGIGYGMVRAIRLLKSSLGTTSGKGASVILLTDGQHNNGPHPSTKIKYAKTNGIAFHCIGFSQASDLVLERIARETGGIYEFSTKSTTSSTLFNAFFAILDNVFTGASAGTASSSPITVASSASTLTAKGILRGEFAIDFTIGESTTVTFNYLQQYARLEVRLEGPDGTVIAKNDTAYSLDSSTQVIQINIPGTATAGKWNYTVTSLNDTTVVSVYVLSKPVDEGGNVGPIKVKSWFGGNNTLDSGQGAKVSLFAEVVRGYVPIVNLTVTATMQGMQTAVIPLQDRGYGVDLVAGDGIYSVEFGRFLLNSQGRYSVTIRVDNPDNSAKIAKYTMVARAPIIGSGAEEPVKSYQTVGPLQRVASGGVLNVTLPSFSTLADVTPPQRIRDLQLVLLDTDKFQVTLKWTSVGDDVSRSNETTYDLRFGAFEDITGRFQNCTQIPFPVVPKNAGEEEMHTIDMSNYNKTETHSLAVSVIDGAGNQGGASNVIFVAMVVPTKFSNGDEIMGFGDNAVSNPNPNLGGIIIPSSPNPNPHGTTMTTIIIIAVSATFGSIILFSIVLGLCIHFRRIRGTWSPEAAWQKGGQGNQSQNVYSTQQQHSVTYDNKGFSYIP